MPRIDSNAWMKLNSNYKVVPKHNYMTSTEIVVIVFFTLAFPSLSYKNQKRQDLSKNPTILMLGGTPSTVDILNQIPDSTKKSHMFISFNRPGFGGSEISEMSIERLIQLAKEAGLHENDYAVIGISGGAPLAILLADAFKIKRCGIISGMVSNEAYFEFADSTFTKEFFKPATESYEQFEKTVSGFPDLDAIVLQAGARPQEEALKASDNELHFILSPNLYSAMENKAMQIDWWHGGT